MNTYEALISVLSYGAFIVPLFLTGPIAAIIFYSVARKKRVDALALFWFLLLTANGMAFLLIIATWGHAWPGPGFFAVLATPISAILSLTILLLTGKRFREFVRADGRWHKLYTAGVVLIPLFQMLTAVVAPGFVIPVCRWLYPRGLGC